MGDAAPRQKGSRRLVYKTAGIIKRPPRPPVCLTVGQVEPGGHLAPRARPETETLRRNCDGLHQPTIYYRIPPFGGCSPYWGLEPPKSAPPPLRGLVVPCVKTDTCQNRHRLARWYRSDRRSRRIQEATGPTCPTCPTYIYIKVKSIYIEKGDA